MKQTVPEDMPMHLSRPMPVIPVVAMPRKTTHA